MSDRRVRWPPNLRMTPKRKALVLLALGVLLGVAVWLLSPWLTGKVEPWDADTPMEALKNVASGPRLRRAADLYE